MKCLNRYAEALTITKIRSFKHETFFFGGGGGGGGGGGSLFVVLYGTHASPQSTS